MFLEQLTATRSELLRLHPTLEALHLLRAVQLIDVTDDSSITLPPLTADDGR